MSEKERRLEYNKRVSDLNAKYQMSRYPGMIQGVELPKMVGTGGSIGIISVVDAVNDGLKPQQRYNPRPGRLFVNGVAVQTPGEQRGLSAIMPPDFDGTREEMDVVPEEKPTRRPTADRRYNLQELLK